MKESADIYAKTQVAFFAPCQEDEVTNDTNVEDFVGHKFPDNYGIHVLATMAFMEQFWAKKITDGTRMRFVINILNYAITIPKVIVIFKNLLQPLLLLKMIQY